MTRNPRRYQVYEGFTSDLSATQIPLMCRRLYGEVWIRRSRNPICGTGGVLCGSTGGIRRIRRSFCRLLERCRCRFVNPLYGISCVAAGLNAEVRANQSADYPKRCCQGCEDLAALGEHLGAGVSHTTRNMAVTHRIAPSTRKRTTVSFGGVGHYPVRCAWFLHYPCDLPPRFACCNKQLS
jgi:hypothetical protein